MPGFREKTSKFFALRGQSGAAGGQAPSYLEIACATVLGVEVEKLAPARRELDVFHGSVPWGDEPCPLWVVETFYGSVVHLQAPLLEAVQAALDAHPDELVLSTSGRSRLLTAVLQLTPISSLWENMNLYTDRAHFVPWQQHPVVALGGRSVWLRWIRTQEPVGEDQMEASFGVKVGGQVVSYADVKRRTDQACSIGCWTDPPYRNRGMGRSAVSAATRHVLATGRVPLYITDKGNAASLALCQSLGYQKFGEDLYCFRPK